MKIVVFEPAPERHDALRQSLAPLSDEIHLRERFDAEADALLGADVLIFGPGIAEQAAVLDYVRRELPPRSNRVTSVLVAVPPGHAGLLASWEDAEADDYLFGEFGGEELTARVRLAIERLQDRRAMQLIERAINNTSDAILITRADPDTREIIYANAGFEAMTGYSSADVAGKSPMLLSGPKTDRKANERITNARRQGAAITEELVNYRKDGSEFYIEVSLSPILTGSGRASHYIGVLRDISKRPDRFLNLKGREHLGGSILEQLQEGILVQDEDGRVTYVNKAMERMLNTNRQELIDGSIHQAIPQYDGSTFQKKFQQAREQRTHVTFTSRFPDSARWLQVDVYPTEDGLAASFRDISATHQSEEIFSLLKAAVDALEESIIITDSQIDLPGPRILYVNEAHCRLSGYHFAEVIGQTPRLFQGPKSERAALDRIRRKMKAGEPVTAEITNYRKDGTEFVAQMAISPIRDREGSIVNFISVLRDITHRRREQEELMQSRKLQAVGELAGGIAHEFNNLLSPMVIQTEQLLAQYGDDANLRDALQPIQQAISQSSALCRRILMLGRKDDEKKSLVSLNEMVTETVELLRRTIDRRIEIRTETGDKLLPLALSRVQIFQVLMNLILNARDTLTERLEHKALSSGGWSPVITISTDTAEATSPGDVNDTTRRFLPCQRILVTDNGMGMSETTRQRLFEPFFTTKDPGSGTGLGLATTWTIVQSLDGWMEVESYQGEGSSFSVYLPVSRDSFTAPEAEPTDTQPLPETDPSKKSILLVDDNDLLRQTLARLLVNGGHTVAQAGDGQDALGMLRDDPEHFDLIITDQNLPKLAGVDFIRELRGIGLKTPVILMSGFLSEETRRKVTDLGVRTVLEKPVAPAEILQAISSNTRPDPAPAGGSQA